MQIFIHTPTDRKITLDVIVYDMIARRPRTWPRTWPAPQADRKLPLREAHGALRAARRVAGRTARDAARGLPKGPLHRRRESARVLRKESKQPESCMPSGVATWVHTLWMPSPLRVQPSCRRYRYGWYRVHHGHGTKYTAASASCHELHLPATHIETNKPHHVHHYGRKYYLASEALLSIQQGRNKNKTEVDGYISAKVMS